MQRELENGSGFVPCPLGHSKSIKNPNLASLYFPFPFHSGKLKGSKWVSYTDYSSWAESGPLPACTNKTLLGHSVLFLLVAVYGCLPVSSAVTGSLNYLELDHLKEHLANLCLKYGYGNSSFRGVFYLFS